MKPPKLGMAAARLLNGIRGLNIGAVTMTGAVTADGVTVYSVK